jgi:glycosyltransferase involved in cell wall biosynthesis
MASGVPVVASNRAALPETCAGAASLVDPADAAAFAEALLAATRGESAHRAAGLDRAAGFTWQRTAELTDAALSDVLD